LICSIQSSCVPLFLYNVPATTENYTLSLHDALPIFPHTELPSDDHNKMAHVLVMTAHLLINQAVDAMLVPAPLLLHKDFLYRRMLFDFLLLPLYTSFRIDESDI